MDNTLYTPGNWTTEEYKSDKKQQLIKTEDKKKLIATVNEFGDVSRKEALNNALIMKESKNLLQIAEMFHDSMKGTEQERTIHFKITKKVLDRINSNK